MLLKNLPVQSLLLKVPFRILLDWIAAIKFILEGNGAHGLAVWKAHFQVLGSIRRTMKKRKMLSNTPERRMVIVDYYLRKKRKFDEL